MDKETTLFLLKSKVKAAQKGVSNSIFITVDQAQDLIRLIDSIGQPAPPSKKPVVIVGVVAVGVAALALALFG